MIYFTPFARFTASARGCDSFRPAGFEWVDVADGVVDASVLDVPEVLVVPVAELSVPVAVLPLVLEPVDVDVASTPAAFVPDVPLAMPGEPVAVSVAAMPVPVAPVAGVVAVVAVVSVAGVAVVAVVSCFEHAVRPRARTPASNKLIGCFIIVTSW
jgi:hypothetical protein